MSQLALVVGNLIHEIIPQGGDLPPVAERYHPDFVACLVAVPDGVEEGWVRSGQSWSAPPVPSTPQIPRVISPRQFMDRLSMSRQAAITAAAMASPEILLWLIRLTGALEVDLDNAETMEGVQTLALAEIITEAEAQALLA